MQITRTKEPTVNERTLMYRNPLGVKGGRNKIAAAVFMAVLAAALVVCGSVYIGREDGVGLGTVLFLGGALYLGEACVYIYTGVQMLKRPYAVIIDGDNLILREKSAYLHLPLSLMRRLTIDCEGIDAYLSVNKEGSYDILIKGDALYYTVDGVQEMLSSRNMRKVAFILNGIALGTEKDVNWGERFDELLSSEHVHNEGAAAGLNKALDESAGKSREREGE